jgi:lipopolysaccharide biosynthesis glycosyltransferase
MNESKLHIALTFDDNFWAPAYATMRSICLSSKRKLKLVFHLCHVGVTAAHQLTLGKVANEFGATVHQYDLTSSDYLAMRIRDLPRVIGRYTPVVYLRLFLADILPVDIDRLIFIDADVLVRAPIEELAAIDLQGCVLGAASESQRLAFQSNRDFSKRPYFDPADAYFNAGIMLTDFRQWRSIDLVKAFTTAVPAAERSRFFQDQDILNMIFRDRWLKLPVTWNFQDPRAVHEPLDIAVMHYTGKHKPWNLLRGDLAYHRTYRHIMTNEVFYQFWRERQVRRLKRLVGRR